MASTAINPRQLAHELVDRIPLSQVTTVVGMMETMLDPVQRAISNAPYDDEESSDEEIIAVAASREWLKHNDPIPNEVVLAEFGLTAEDFERMGRTPLE